MRTLVTTALSASALSIVLLAVATAAIAQGSSATGKSKAAVPRIDRGNATATAELNRCAEIRLKKADSEMSTSLERARAQISRRATTKPDERTAWLARLEEAHKAWTLYREADCKGLVPHEWQGGTGATLAVLECLAQMTEQRAFELGERYSEKR